jgi:hypothetical protein
MCAISFLIRSSSQTENGSGSIEWTASDKKATKKHSSLVRIMYFSALIMFLKTWAQNTRFFYMFKKVCLKYKGSLGGSEYFDSGKKSRIQIDYPLPLVLKNLI